MTDDGRQEPGSRVAWARLVSNSNWNFAAFAIVVLANFLTLPYVVHRLGMAQFGLGGLVLAMLAPMMFVGAVVGQACVRELAPMLAADRGAAARDVLASGLALCACACVLVLVAVGVAGPYLIRRLTGWEAVASVDLPLIVWVAGLGWVAQQLFQVLQSAIVSSQQFRALALLNVVSALVSAFCLLAFTWFAPTVAGFIGATAAGFACTLLLTLWQARRHASALFPLARPQLADMRRILAFCRWQVPAQLAGAFSLQTDRYLLGATAPMSVVGQFNVATRLQEVVYMGVLKISEVLFPHFSAGAGKPEGAQAGLFLASSWIVNAIAAAALAPLIPLSGAIVRLWVGESAVELGAPMLRTLVTAGIVGSGVNVFTYFALGHGQTKRLGVMSLVHALAVVVASTALVLGWGALAAGAGFLVANVLRLAWATLVTPAMIGSRMAVTDAMQATLLPLVAGLVVGWGWQGLAEVDSWLAVAIDYVVIGCAVLASSVCISALFPVSRGLIRAAFKGLQGHFGRR